jgi:hypothetical protein
MTNKTTAVTIEALSFHCLSFFCVWLTTVFPSEKKKNYWSRRTVEQVSSVRWY